jgi:ribose transport system ATP-binding protein
MKHLAENERIGIILVSSEMKELLKCSNRVITIYEGQITGEFDTATTNRETIVGSIIGAGDPHHA